MVLIHGAIEHDVFLRCAPDDFAWQHDHRVMFYPALRSCKVGYAISLISLIRSLNQTGPGGILNVTWIDLCSVFWSWLIATTIKSAKGESVFANSDPRHPVAGGFFLGRIATKGVPRERFAYTWFHPGT